MKDYETAKMNSKHKNKYRRKSSDILVIHSPNGADDHMKSFTLSQGPIPNRDELQTRFRQALTSMDLKDDKRQILEDYSDEKKWQLVCDTTLVSAKQQPDFYINSIKNHLNDLNGKGKNNKLQETWELTLSDLEISLRTNSIKWVKEFLSRENNGLDAIIDLLNHSLQTIMPGNEHNQRQSSLSLSSSKPVSLFGKSSQEKNKVQTSKSASSDIHLCVKCLKAIMNHKTGFAMIFVHEKAINCIVLSLLLNSHKTRTLVLDVISVLCLVKGGHAKVLRSFEYMKKVCSEERRFEKLIGWFMSEEGFNLDFSVACIRCINLLVHSPEDMNFRVFLQHEFKLLMLEDYLTILLKMESESLSSHINAYLSNCFDVSALMSDAKHVNEMKDKAEELNVLKRKLEDVENSALEKIAHLESQFNVVTQERNAIEVELERLEDETKRINATQHSPPQQQGSSSNSSDVNQSISAPLSSDIPPPPPPPPPPPFSPPLPGMPPGNVAGKTNASSEELNKEQKSDSVKGVIKSRQRLAALNWTPINQSQIKGTIYDGINEESIYKILNLEELEERFKLHSKRFMESQDHLDNNNSNNSNLNIYRTVRSIVDVAGLNTILLPNRRQNVAIVRRKLHLGTKELTEALENFDLQTLTPERVDLLERLMPNEEEEVAFESFTNSGKSKEELTEDDQFMIALMTTKRFKQKLQAMSLVSNLDTNLASLLPQIQAIKAASTSLKSSKMFKKLIQIILAVGNYMNSQNRGGAYGFKLQNLELLSDTKSNDRKQTLLHFIVKICQEKFPEVLTFHKELNFTERAAAACLEVIVSDLAMMKKQLSSAEMEMRENNKLKSQLQNFFTQAKDKLQKTETEHNSAMESFQNVASYFGENPKSATPNVFFGIINKFVNSFKQTAQILSTSRRGDSSRNSHLPPFNRQSEILDELKHKVKEKKVLNQDEVGFGTVDGILEDLKNEPFVRHDAYYKSRRK